MSIINHITTTRAIMQRCLKYWIIAPALLLMATACGPGEPITPAAFCSESIDQMQLIRAQMQTVSSTADTFNNFNAITVTIAIKRESDYLADLALEASTLSPQHSRCPKKTRKPCLHSQTPSTARRAKCGPTP